jgi:hypothetical protein
LADVAGKHVRTFVVWEPVLFTDWSSPSTTTLARISVSGALQFWDKERVISRSMGEHDRRSVVWDYIAVYAAGTVWDQHTPQALYSGGPVIRVIDETRTALAQALQRGQIHQAGYK